MIASIPADRLRRLRNSAPMQGLVVFRDREPHTVRGFGRVDMPARWWPSSRYIPLRRINLIRGCDQEGEGVGINPILGKFGTASQYGPHIRLKRLLERLRQERPIDFQQRVAKAN